MNNFQYAIQIPLVSTNGKIRIRQRRMIYDYGNPVATRQTVFSQDMYVEKEKQFIVSSGETALFSATARYCIVFWGGFCEAVIPL